MKILFAIQGTGNGHLSRARDVYPELIKYGAVDVLISGIQADVAVPFPVKYKFYGMSFIFGKKGGVNIKETILKSRPAQLIRDIGKLPVGDYDIVINDFEPVSAWACKIKKQPCISLSHQCVVLHANAPKPPKSDLMGITVLKYYAPTTAQYGFHFKSYAQNIFTPVIRKEVRDMMPTNEGHYTVYLPAYDDATIVANLAPFDNVKWNVFSKHNKQPFTHQTVQVRPIENNAFIESMASGAGVLCGAGFEGPAEAMYLGKKVMVVPMDGQYEQQCNAVAIAELGVPVISQLNKKYASNIKEWLDGSMPSKTDFPDQIAEIVAQIMREHAPAFAGTRKKELVPAS